jgi:hypothetical protein
VLLADDPTELVQQLARNAQDALRRLATNLQEEKELQSLNTSLSPSKQRKPPRAPSDHANTKPPSHGSGPTRRGPQASGPDKYLSPGGGYNGATGGGERKPPARGTRKKGSGEKLSTGEEVTPDLPAEELQRLEAIRAQMRNLMSSIGGGF